MKLSIIVVAYNIENFIGQALESAIPHGRTDCEVIVVENKSTDRTLAVIEEVAAGFPGIVRIIANDKNYGLGIARNIGMKHASGEYLMFLDGDDWLADTAIDRILGAADENPCDILVFNHARFHDDGSYIPNKLTHIMSEGYRDTPALRVDIMRNFGVAWNKLYRKSLIQAAGLEFRAGFYEDIDWNFSLLLRAPRYYVIPDILIFYRQRSGSITRSPDAKHFDILTQYSRVIDELAMHPDREICGATAYTFARNQILNVLHSPDRLPAGSKARFLREAAQLLSRFRSVINRKNLTLRERAAASGNLFVYRATARAISWFDKTGRFLRDLTMKAGKRVRKTIVSLLYHQIYLRGPMVSNKVVLEAFWGRKIDCNPYAIGRALEQRGFECVWSLSRKEAPEHYPDASVVRRGSLAYYRAVAQAKYLVSNANLPDALVKRPGQVHVQTFHGTPLKFMGLDIIRTNPEEMDWKTYALRSRRWDFALSSNPHSTRTWRRNSPYNYKMIEAGYPRNDILFNATPDFVVRVRKTLGIPEGKKAVLYAPTFRNEQKDRNAGIGAGNSFDLHALQQAFGDEYVILIRGHYFLKGIDNPQDDKIIDVSAYQVTNEVLLAADVLITDYSSIMFDYANLARPVILYPYDYDHYERTRGLYLDIRKDGPGLVATRFEDLLGGIRDRSFENGANQERLARFRQRFCTVDDGKATERVIDAVFTSLR